MTVRRPRGRFLAMDQKVSTVMKGSLWTQIRVLAVKQRRRVQDLLEEAVVELLRKYGVLP